MCMEQNFSKPVFTVIWLFELICKILIYFFSHIYFNVYLPDELYAQKKL